MIIEVKKLNLRKQYEGNFSFDYTPQQDKVLLPLCSFDGNVKVEGEYVIYEDESVGVKFKITYTLKGQCSYCLEDAQKTIEFLSDVLYVRDKDDADNYYYDGIKIDLTTAVDDALLISQPDVLLCKEGCDGIKIN
jgi:uncharacterized metal-binding protein YceD (DUF177 family)